LLGHWALDRIPEHVAQVGELITGLVTIAAARLAMSMPPPAETGHGILAREG